jgi:beta-xylosidase
MPLPAHRRPRLWPAVTTIALVGATLASTGPPGQAADEWQPASSYTSTDQGDGTYSVPLLGSDVPDVSVERVPAAENDEGRDVYYMISTTMHLSPGAPIMKSYDLVNWEIVNHVFDRLGVGDSFSLRNGQNSYGQGQWASSLRYHAGKFYGSSTPTAR